MRFQIAEPSEFVDDEYYLRRAFAEFEAGEKGFTLDECNERMKAAIIVYGIQDETVIAN
jgi:hypothetical protein